MTLTRTRTKNCFSAPRRVFPTASIRTSAIGAKKIPTSLCAAKNATSLTPTRIVIIDYRLGFGPVILGHGYPAVVDRVTNAIKDGTVYAATHPLEITVARTHETHDRTR